MTDITESETFNTLKGFIEEYIDGFEGDDNRIVVGTLDEFLEEINIEHYFENLDTPIDEMVEELWERFTAEYFNDWEEDNHKGFHYWFSGESPYEDLDNHFTIGNFLFIYNACIKWFKDEYDVSVEIKNEIHTWNTIAYWCFKVGDFSSQKERLKTELVSEIERIKKNKEVSAEFSGKSRLSCVICLENKVIYTGCSTCSSGLLCYECYSKIGNVCPVCRCPQMVQCVKCCHFVKVGDGPDVHYRLNTDRIDWERKLANVVGDIKK